MLDKGPKQPIPAMSNEHQVAENFWFAAELDTFHPIVLIMSPSRFSAYQLHSQRYRT